jgi:hypothetical protein
MGGLLLCGMDGYAVVSITHDDYCLEPRQPYTNLRNMNSKLFNQRYDTHFLIFHAMSRAWVLATLRFAALLSPSSRPCTYSFGSPARTQYQAHVSSVPRFRTKRPITILGILDNLSTDFRN